ncbi:MAG: hypothetical protein RI905_493 [Pseudomonadota bacterium]|jgi:uncharacterized protein (TIGR02001 family)
MKTYLTLSAIALAAAATLSSGAVIAADPAPAAAPTPEFVLTGNFGVVSDYRFRGISQNNTDPAIQGGFDLAHSSGLYIGTWASTVSSWTAGASSAHLETDLYGGFKTEVAGVGLDIGAIAYMYPGSASGYKANTQEAYVGLAYGPATFKTSYVLSKAYFASTYGPADSNAGLGSDASGTIYYDLTVAQEIAPKLTASVHAGYTDYKNDAAYIASGGGKLSYADYNVGLAYDLNGYVFGVKYFFNDVKPGTKTYAGATSSNPNLYKNGLVVSVLKAF